MRKRVYHLGIEKKQLRGCRLAFVPGDPGRCAGIIKTFDPKTVTLASNREFTTCLGKLDGEPVIATSTGIGGPSTSIALEELAILGVETFIRIGTTGAIQKHVGLGDAIISTGAVRLDGTSDHYAPVRYPAVADFAVTRALVDVARAARIRHHTGITASCASFYPGQERYDSHSEYVIRELQGSLHEWQSLNVLNYEMEAGTLFTVCSALGLRAGCVAGVIVNRTRQEGIREEVLATAERHGIAIAVAAARRLLKEKNR